MRKNPTSDADETGRPADADAPDTGVIPAPDAAADRAAVAGADSTAPSLIWPPVEDELNEWEVVPIQSTGHTVIEPMKFTPPPTPAPYVPPSPIDDPVGEASLGPLSADFDLPETELIEPLTLQPTLPTMPAVRPPAMAATDDTAARRSGSHPAATDDRTIMLPRPAMWTRPESPVTAVVPPPSPASTPSSDDTNAGATRILVAPNFSASVGHAPTVPVSALHRATRPQPAFGPRHPMEETLPAGVTRDMLAGGAAGSDDTAVSPALHEDTHPVPSPVARRAAAASGPVSPFSRVPSRGPQPALTPDAAPEPAPISLAPPPLAFGPRLPAQPGPTSPASGAMPAAPPAAPLAQPAAARPPAPPAAPSMGRDAAIPTRPAPTSAGRKIASLGIALAVVLALALGVYQVLSMRSTAAAGPANATLSVESSPAGATVSIDGTPRGTTPMRLELPEGSHALEVGLKGATRRVPLTLAAGTITAHSFEFAAPAAAVTADAAVEVRSEPAGARVLVDGVPRGLTPIVVTGLTAGRHEVQVSGPFRPVTRQVTLVAKQQTRLVITPAQPPAGVEPGEARPARAAAGTGFIAIESPIVLRVVRNGDFVGTSEDARLSLPVGSQVIGLENESVGFRDVRTVEIVAGKVTPVPVSLPKGEISINARPWAEVFVDGTRVGETPVSQLALPVGIHEILFRHPEHGERRVSVVVKIGATGRAFTDFTK